MSGNWPPPTDMRTPAGWPDDGVKRYSEPHLKRRTGNAQCLAVAPPWYILTRGAGYADYLGIATAPHAMHYSIQFLRRRCVLPWMEGRKSTKPQGHPQQPHQLEPKCAPDSHMHIRTETRMTSMCCQRTPSIAA